MRSGIRRWLWGIMLMAAVLGVAESAHAVTDLGQLCLGLGNLGAITDNATEPGSYDLVLGGIMTSEAPGVLLPAGPEVKTRSLFATLRPPFFGGSFRATCTGGGAPATLTGSMSPISCNDVGAFRP